MTLRNRVRASEGLRLKAYPDPLSPLAKACRAAGIRGEDYFKLPGWRKLSGAPWTIGFGHTRDVKEGDICSTLQAETWLDDDLDHARHNLVHALMWASTLDAPRLDVLVEMSFNLGITRLLDFHNTLAAVRRGDWPVAAAGMLASAWASQVGKRATQLARIMRTGEDE